jgi:preprotein translocase subunit YajC
MNATDLSTTGALVVESTASTIVAHQAAAGGQPGLLSSLPMMLAILAIFYFLMIRPQQQEAKRQAELISKLQKGDMVLTAFGLHGKVAEVRDTTILLEVADKVRIVIEKSAVKTRLVEDVVVVDGGKPA